MTFDANLKLYDAAFDRRGNTNVFPNGNKNGFETTYNVQNGLGIGRTGLPTGAQFIVGIDNPGGTAGDNPTLTVHLRLSLDNGATNRTIATVEFGDPTDNFQGQIAVGIDQSFAWQEYADANIDLSLLIVPISDNTTGNNLSADKLYAYIGTGEVTRWGRAKNADTLFV